MTVAGSLSSASVAAVFVGDEIMTSSTGGQLRFWAHKQLTKEVFYSLKILFDIQFDNKVDWCSVYDALHEVHEYLLSGRVNK